MPVMVRVGLTAFIATLIAGLVPPARIPLDLPALGVAGGSEIILGLVLGFVGRCTFAGVDFAGRLISSEVGFSAPPGLGGPNPASEPLAAFLSTLAVVMFFLFGGHLSALGAFARSFALVPPGQPALAPGADEAMILMTARVIELGLRIATPFIAFNFLVTLAFSVLGRAIPRMQVFVISASVKTMGGLALLATGGALIGHHLYGEFAVLPEKMLSLVAGH